MIKSSESASASHYKYQNFRRNSFLSRNKTEEDINALLKETESKNMNILFFNYEITKISINIELNA